MRLTIKRYGFVLLVLCSLVNEEALFAYCNNITAYQILTRAPVSPQAFLSQYLPAGHTFDVSEKSTIRLKSMTGSTIGILEYNVHSKDLEINYVANISNGQKDINKLLMAKVLAMYPDIEAIKLEMAETNLQTYVKALGDTKTSRISAFVLTPAFRVATLFGYSRIDPASTTSMFVTRKGKPSGLPKDAFTTVEKGFPLADFVEIGRGGDAVVYTKKGSETVIRISHPDAEPIARTSNKFEERLLENLKLLNAIKYQEKIGGPAHAQLQFLMNERGEGVFAIEMEKLAPHVQFPGAMTMRPFWSKPANVARLRQLILNMLNQQTGLGFYNHDFQVAVEVDSETGHIPDNFKIRPLDPGQLRFGNHTYVEAKNEKSRVEMNIWIDEMVDLFGK